MTQVNSDRAVTDDESRNCEICSMLFTKRKNMLRHVRDVHKVSPEANTRVKCDVCGVGLSSLEEYVRHHTVTHEFVAEYVQRAFLNDKDTAGLYAVNLHPGVGAEEAEHPLADVTSEIAEAASVRR
ncbi:hypothetical protein MRX96_020441 [Rhipicephalus microplus]